MSLLDVGVAPRAAQNTTVLCLHTLIAGELGVNKSFCVSICSAATSAAAAVPAVAAAIATISLHFDSVSTVVDRIGKEVHGEFGRFSAL